MANSLLKLLIRQIDRTGPITVAEYMAKALHHPEFGYYSKGNPLGKGGDFITAPEISQIFGELIGVWIITMLENLSHLQQNFCLVELGPGRGTLMSDILRTIKILSDYSGKLEVHLIESNSDLRSIQAKAFSGYNPVWHDDLSSLPEKPWMLIANEFLDALPIHQFIFNNNAWHKRLVGINTSGTGLVWGLDRLPSNLGKILPQDPYEKVKNESVAEICPSAHTIVSHIANNVLNHGGAALLIDYGDERHAMGNSLQSISSQKPVDPLLAPGLCDLSSHVDFSSIRGAAVSSGADFHGPVSQSAFLHALGISQRVSMLKAVASQKQQQSIDSSLHRLTASEHMGSLFKVAAITHPTAPTPAGFSNK